MAVITISRQYGSGGDEIVDRVCKMLDYRCFDKQFLIRAASEAGLSELEIVDYSEESYKVENFLNRLFSRNWPVGQASKTIGKLNGEPGLTEAVAFSLVSIYFSRVDIKIMRDSLAAKTKKANKSTTISCKKGKLDCLSVYYCKIIRK